MKNKSVKLIGEILLFSFLIIVIVRFFVERNGNREVADTLFWITIGLSVAIIIFRLFYWLAPKWFGNKPTREELEEKQFGKKN